MKSAPELSKGGEETRTSPISLIPFKSKLTNN
jgi:hypothetical protein